MKFLDDRYLLLTKHERLQKFYDSYPSKTEAFATGKRLVREGYCKDFEVEKGKVDRR